MGKLTALDEPDALLSEVRPTVAQRSDDALDRPIAAFRVLCEEAEPWRRRAVSEIPTLHEKGERARTEMRVAES